MKTFVFILLAAVVCYGVASQSLIDPYRVQLNSWEEFKNLFGSVFLLPYWQMYGELNLEE